MVYMYMPARYKRPSPYIEEPQRRITIPLTIGTYRNDPLTIQILKSPKRWVFKQKPTTKNTGNKLCPKNPVCKWYRRKRALRQLHNLHKFEKATPIHDKLDPKTALELYEKQQRMIENIRQEKLLKKQETPRTISRKERREHLKFEPSNVPLDRDQYKKSRLKKKRLEQERYDIDKFEKEYDQKNEKARLKRKREDQKQYEKARLKQERKDQKRYEKERLKQERIELKLYKKEQKRLAREQANKNKELARLSKKQEIYERTNKKVPKADTKSVYAKGKKQRYKEPLSYRFTNCFYRFCCQLYCYFTFFLIIAVVIVIIIP